jgi:hypothetical protein
MSNPGDFTFGRAELEAAVAKGVIDRNAADSLTEFLVQNRNAASEPDEERLRLLTGFNDIFVTIGIALFLGALSYLLSNYGALASGAGVAIAAWGLAEIFTKRKRMALPSIVLLVVFVATSAGVSHTLFAPVSSLFSIFHYGTLPGLPYGLAAVAASILHWFRFRVPITIAAFAAGLASVVVAAIETFNSGFVFEHAPLVFIPIGLAIFAVAMKFDMSDRNRVTQRTDIAFWLHLLAAPVMVHSIVYPLMAERSFSTNTAIAILSLFAVLSLVALTIDRRALLVSSLLYLGYASSQLLTWWGVTSKNFGSWSGVTAENQWLSILIVGGTVLVLSVAWQPLRRIVLGILPQSIRNLVPPAAA